VTVPIGQHIVQRGGLGFKGHIQIEGSPHIGRGIDPVNQNSEIEVVNFGLNPGIGFFRIRFDGHAVVQ